jgi:SAM-dependent MidA family methyltransferase
LNSQPAQPNLPLAERLRERIGREGAVTFRDWMETALYDERGGYYNRPDLARWGRSGDYRTAPERSPLFAATFARHFSRLHAELGSPRRWTILEAGAGAGHFARGVLEILASDHPTVFDATCYVIDEGSAAARELTLSRLAGFAGRVEFAPLKDLPASAFDGVVFSNELLDALPVHRVRVHEGRLRELCVALDEAGDFCWVEREPSTPRLAEHFRSAGVKLAEGQAAEVNLAAGEWIGRAARVLSRGFLVTVDYGAPPGELYDVRLRPDGTLRAFTSHRLSDDLLARPGEQDLTSTINWTQIVRAGESAGLGTVLLERLDTFLLHAGLPDQLESLAARAPTESERASLRLSARELILPGGLAQSFQVLIQQKP